MLGNNNSRRKSEGCGNGDGFDRISELPDVILTQILSSLPTEDFSRLTLLSKRLKSLWYPLSTLDLDFNRFSGSYDDSSNPGGNKNNDVERFTGFVKRMLSLHQGRQLEGFRLFVDISEDAYGKDNRNIVRDWIRFAFRSTCTTLDIEFGDGRGDSCDEYTYKLPRCSRVIRYVNSMKLAGCQFLPRRYKIFESLKTLYMLDVRLPDRSVEDLNRKCPLLEDLHFEKCLIPSVFEFYSSQSKLKIFTMESCRGLENEEITDVIIDVPSLVKLKFSGDLLVIFSVTTQDLVEADIYFEEYCVSFEYLAMVEDLLFDLTTVRTLKICDSFLKLITKGEDVSVERLKHTFRNLKHLSLETCLGDSELKNFVVLLMSSPYLETLIIELQPPSSGVVENFWESLLAPIDCLRHLKMIELKSFAGRSNQMEFVSYMLQNALVLEKVVIDTAAMKSRDDTLKREGDEGKLKEWLDYKENMFEKLLAVKNACLTAAQIVFS